MTPGLIFRVGWVFPPRGRLPLPRGTVVAMRWDKDLPASVKLARPCLDCGELTTQSRCPVHRIMHDNIRYARRGTTRARGLSGTHALMSMLFKQQARTCECPGCGTHDGVCGVSGTAANPITAGHILARSFGGTNTPGNYRPECKIGRAHV